MIHIKQTKKTNCGQACLAMITGNTIESVSCSMGKIGLTKTKDLHSFLVEMRYKSTINKLTRVNATTLLPDFCICSVSLLGTNYKHWIVCRDGRIFDPALECDITLSHYQVYFKYRKITSYIEIRK